MKKRKTFSSISRLACALLAFVTVVTAAPLLVLETHAEDASTSVDEILDFDSFEAGTVLTTGNLTATLSSTAKVESMAGNITAVADGGNIVSYNTGDAYRMNIVPGDLYQKDFVVSGDFKFETFPSKNGGAGNVSCFAWVIGSSYKIFCGVDQDGNLLSRSSDKSYAPTGVVLNRNQWYNISVHYDGSSGKFNVYLDGVYACSGTWAPPSSKPSSQYIRVLNNYESNNFKAYVDNLQVYELTYSEDSTVIPEDGVIYDIDFESGFAGTKPTMAEIEALSPYGGIADYNVWTTKGTLVKDNGNTSIKISGGTDSHRIDLVTGNGTYDPLKYGTVRCSLDINFESFPSSSTYINLVSWRKMDFNASAKAYRAFQVYNTGEVNFCGKSTGYTLETGEDYNIELIFNNRILKNVQYTDITLKINGDVIVDSCTYLGTSSIKNENYAYFLDDAGIKRYMPYTGLVSSYRYDEDGNKMTDADSNYLYADRLVIGRTTSSPDMIRLFQGSGGACSGFTYYVDDIVIEQIEDKSIIDTTFEGWELYNYDTVDGKDVFSQTGTKNSLFILANNNNRFNRDSAKIVTNNGNTYAQLGGTDISSQKHFFVYDPDLNFYGKDIIIETKVYLSAVSSTAYSTPGSMIATASKKTASGSYDNFGFLLRADHNGYLYTDADKVNPIGRLKVGDWTKISIILTGNGTTWNNIRILIDDELVSSIPKSFSVMEASRFRFTNMAYTVIGYDDLSIRPYVEEVNPAPLTMGFESTAETSEMISALSGDWVYGTIGATRVDADGVTVKKTEILGDEGAKYLRVNHSRVKESELASFIDAKESKFIYKDTYLIETAVRYTANTAYGLTVAEVYDAEKAQSAPLLYVKGETNELYIKLRGVSYNIVNGAKSLIYAPKTDANDFVKVAILVDDVNKTYTLYVNDRLAYYLYGDEAIPCIDLPMHFMDTNVDFNEDFIRLLEISSVKYADSILDIDYVNVKSTPNGLSAEIKGSQTRAVTDTDGYDVRFVSGVDTLYASKIGYEITAEYTDTSSAAQVKNDDISNNIVFNSIKAGTGTDEKTITAEELDSGYLSVVTVRGIDVDVTVKFTVKPYVDRGGKKIYGETYTASFKNGEIVK